jgi:hypothetical protein
MILFFVVVVVAVVVVVVVAAKRLATLATCKPNSRVGTTMSACTADRVGSMAAKQGNKKAKVLPLPVCPGISVTDLFVATTRHDVETASVAASDSQNGHGVFIIYIIIITIIIRDDGIGHWIGIIVIIVFVAAPTQI